MDPYLADTSRIGLINLILSASPKDEMIFLVNKNGRTDAIMSFKKVSAGAFRGMLLIYRDRAYERIFTKIHPLWIGAKHLKLVGRLFSLHALPDVGFIALLPNSPYSWSLDTIKFRRNEYIWSVI